MSVNSNRLLEIDFIKGIAITSVILLHTLSADLRSCILSIYHIGQAVPIFISITFFLSFQTLDRNNCALGKWYSKTRMSTVFKRIVLPVLVINLLQILVFFVLKRNDLIISVLGGVRAWGLLCLGLSAIVGFNAVPL